MSQGFQNEGGLLGMGVGAGALQPLELDIATASKKPLP